MTDERLQEIRAENRKLWQAFCRRADNPTDELFADIQLYASERARLERICSENYERG
ncbi:MAG: hypothetical protein WA618_09035 [Terriglobales bacterium]